MQKKEEWMTLHDLWEVLYKHREKGYWVFGFFFACALWLSLTAPVTYLAEASFRDKGMSKESMNSSLISFLGGPSNPENEAKSTFLSKALIGEVVQELGLQATISEHRSRFRHRLKTVRQNILTEYASFRRQQKRVHPDVPEVVRPTHVVYRGEEPLSVAVYFRDEKSYVLRRGTEVVAEGLLDAPCVFAEGEVTLSRCALGLLGNRQFDLTFFSFDKKATEYQRGLRIKTDKKKDHRVLELSFSHPDRHLSACFLNVLMSKYQEHLQRKQQRHMQEQLGYLEERRVQNRRELTQLLDAYAESLAFDIAQSGFTQTKEELAFLAACQQKYRDRLMTSDLDLLRLERAQTTQSVPFSMLSSENDSVKTWIAEIRKLHTQRDDLIVRGMGVEKVAGEKSVSEGFEGLSLEAAQSLLFEITKQQHAAEAEAEKYGQLKESLSDPAFEIPSLSALLHDPVVQESVAETKKCLVAYQDEPYRSAKEQERLKQEMELQRRFLQQHLAQTQKLFDQQTKALQMQRVLLQQQIFDLVSQQIAILENHISDFLFARMQELEGERGILHRYMGQVQQAMRDLPKKWVQEQLLQEELQSREKVVEELAKTVEMKNIALHLEMIDSAPVDCAVASLHPQKPRLFLSLFLAALFGGLVFFGSLCLVLQRGICATPRNLSDRGYLVAGTWAGRPLVDPLVEGDLALLRRVGAFLTDQRQSKTALLVEGKGPHYAKMLAYLLHRRGLRVCLVDFSCRANDIGKGEGKKEEFGYFTPWKEGGPWGWESVSRESLQKLQEELGQFDLLLGYTEALPVQAETLAVHFSSIVVTVEGEQMADLAWYLNHNSDKTLFLFS